MRVPAQDVIPSPFIRIYTADNWNGQWVQRAYFTDRDGGFRLLSCERAALPAIGEAQLSFAFGQFVRLQGGGVQVVGGDSTAAPGSWSPGSDTVTLPDLTGKYVLIQAAVPEFAGDDPVDSDYEDIWLGGVEYHRDVGAPGATVPQGERIYYCVDLWSFVARRWVNTHYSFKANDADGSAQEFPTCRGHPGYNVGDGRVAGNRWSGAGTYQPPGTSGASEAAFFHTYPGGPDSTVWTDAQVIQHQINRARVGGEPWFEFTDPASLFTAPGEHMVPEGSTVFDVVGSICDRRRGRGAVVLEWSIDASAAASESTLTLKAYPQTKDSVSWSGPGDSGSFLGASSTNSTVDMDLIGDHRVIDSSFRIAERNQHRVDYLETVSERIEVVFTAAYADETLEEGWDTDSFETTYHGESTAADRLKPEYDQVYHLHKLPDAWVVSARNGSNGLSTGLYFSCADDGSIQLSADEYASPADLRVMPDLPLLVGYDYSGGSASRYDSLGNVRDPQRRPLAVYLADPDNDDQFFDLTSLSALSPSWRMTREGLYLVDSSDRSTGQRKIGDTAEDIGSTHDYTDLAVTMSVLLPNRVRLADGDGGSRFRRRIYVPGLHLHLAHSGCIWELGAASEDASGTPKRGALGASGTTPGILRDDRDTLAQYHALAWSWYGSGRQPVQFALRACGLLSTYGAFASVSDAESDDPAVTPSTHDYPKLGEVIDTLAANGENHSIGTPVTRIRYDHRAGSTTWSCDWVELDFSRR